jgi:hypothetical protein
MTLAAYWIHCAVTLGTFYLAGALVWLLVAFLLRLARANPGLDRALGAIPLLGKLRRHLALSRFCATYEMQLQAGINVMDSVRAAGDSSQSARIQSTIARLIPEMRSGTSLGTLITGEGAWAGYYQKTAVDALETLGAWISRLVYVVIAAYFVYSIISAEVSQLNTVDQMLKE